MNGFGGDGIGSTATDAGNIITGKDNVQVVTTMDKRPHDDTNDLWRAVQRIETNVMSLGNKLDLALSEQGRSVAEWAVRDAAIIDVRATAGAVGDASSRFDDSGRTD
jgi:hypothetical protein